MKTGCSGVCCAPTIVGANTARSSIAAAPPLVPHPGLEPLEAARLPIRNMMRTEPSDNGRASRDIRSGSSSEPLDKRRGKPAHVQNSLLDRAATGASHPSSARGVQALWAIVTSIRQSGSPVAMLNSTSVRGAGDDGSRLKPITRIQIFAGLVTPEMFPQNYSPPSKGSASKAVDFREENGR